MEYIPTLPPSGNFGRNLTNKQRLIILFIIYIPLMTGVACITGFFDMYDEHSLLPYLLGFRPCQTAAEPNQRAAQAVETTNPEVQALMDQEREERSLLAVLAFLALTCIISIGVSLFIKLTSPKGKDTELKLIQRPAEERSLLTIFAIIAIIMAGFVLLVELLKSAHQ